MSRRYAEWSADGRVEVVTHGPTEEYRVHAVQHVPGLLLGPLLGTVEKDTTQARTHEWIASSHGVRTFHPTLAVALTAIANREAALQV